MITQRRVICPSHIVRMIGLALLFSAISSGSGYAQTMKVKEDTGPREKYGFRPYRGQCQPIPPSSGSRGTKGISAKDPSIAAAPHDSVSPPTSMDSLRPVASAVWRITPKGNIGAGSVSYCVRVGVTNDTGIASQGGTTLKLTDIRSIDNSYRNEYFQAPLSTEELAILQALHPSQVGNATQQGNGAPTKHAAMNACAATIPQALEAHQTLAAANTWCVSNLDLRKRPKLLLTMAGPGTSEPIECRVEFPDEQYAGNWSASQMLAAPVAQCNNDRSAQVNQTKRK